MLHQWVRQAERGAGQRPGLSSEERERLNPPERENHGLRRASGILRKASAAVAQAELEPPRAVAVGFVNAHREQYGVEPICAEVPIASATYDEHKTSQARKLSAKPAAIQPSTLLQCYILADAQTQRDTAS